MKKLLTKIWLQICKKAYWTIFIFLVIFSIIFLILSFVIKPSASWSNFVVDLSAGFVSALITVFFIDFLRESNKEIKWSGSKSVAKDDLFELTNMLISYITIPFGYIATNYEIDESNLKRSTAKVLKQILDEMLKKDLVQMVTNLNFEKWRDLELNLLFLKPIIFEHLLIYSEILDPELYSCLLKTRRTFNKLYSTFGLMNIGWIKDKKLPPDKILASLAEDLKEYFISVSDLSKIVYGQE